MIIKLIQLISYWTYRCLSSTWSIDYAPIPIEHHIMGIWHEDLTVILKKLSHQNYLAQVSLSQDGQLLTYFFQHLGFTVFRGSSSNGAISIRSCLIGVEAGKNLTMALDGPKGPRKQAKPGTQWVADKTSTPFYVTRVHYTRLIRLNTWDQMAWPLPFSRIQIGFELQDEGDNI